MLTFAQLQSEVGEWSRRNFPDSTPRDPYEGVIEELGELAHSRLKGRQGIRGDAAKHEAGEKDALADMVVFVCNYADRAKYSLESAIEYEFSRHGEGQPDDKSIATIQEHVRHLDLFDDSDDAFVSMAERVGPIIYGGTRLGEIILDLCAYASLRGFDLETIVAETWAQVRQRDWKKDPACGGLSAPEVKVMDFAKGEIVSLPIGPNGMVVVR